MWPGCFSYYRRNAFNTINFHGSTALAAALKFWYIVFSYYYVVQNAPFLSHYQCGPWVILKCGACSRDAVEQVWVKALCGVAVFCAFHN